MGTCVFAFTAQPPTADTAAASSSSSDGTPVRIEPMSQSQLARRLRLLLTESLPAASALLARAPDSHIPRVRIR
ncbi:hypothetical protein D3C86_1778000 [compost metagenome]